MTINKLSFPIIQLIVSQPPGLMEPTNWVQISIRMKTCNVFSSGLFSGELHYGQSRMILSAGEQRDSKSKSSNQLQPMIAHRFALGKTHCLEKSQVPVAISN